MAAACAGGADADESPSQRRIAASLWDTTLVIGSSNPNDTTLLTPTDVVIWADRIAVLDRPNQVLRTFTQDGRLLWSLAAQGGGPGEIRNALELDIGPESNLWLLDDQNVKILVIDENGRLVTEKPLYHLPVQPRTMLLGGDTIVFTSQSPGHGVMIVEADSIRLLRSGPYPWPDALPIEYNLVTNIAGSYRNGWAGAFEYGPGFVIMRNGSASEHRYIQHVPWALKSGPHIRAIGADSARYAARAISVVDDEIFMLFGGRPYRAAHPAEPTRLIDVYGMDGEYRRSYRLPSNTWEMVTADGELFYVLTMGEDGNPFLLGLRPRENTERQSD